MFSFNMLQAALQEDVIFMIDDSPNSGLRHTQEYYSYESHTRALNSNACTTSFTMQEIAHIRVKLNTMDTLNQTAQQRHTDIPYRNKHGLHATSGVHFSLH